MHTSRGFGIPAIIAIIAALVAVGGVLYFNMRPKGEIMQNKGDDMLHKGVQMVTEGSTMMEDGKDMMQEGHDMMSTSTATTSAGN